MILPFVSQERNYGAARLSVNDSVHSKLTPRKKPELECENKLVGPAAINALQSLRGFVSH
jgi:hypothetical protein